MSDTVKRIFDLMEGRTLVPSSYIAKHKGSASAHLTNDLRMDSLDMVELVEAVWEEWDIDIPDDKAEQINTVGDLAKFIDDELQRKKAT